MCERFLRSVRQACLDHLLILHEKQHEPRAQRLCAVLQSSQTTSRDQAYRFQNRMVDLFRQIMTVAQSSPSRSWEDYITTTAESREI
jgi:hypothetical protein